MNKKILSVILLSILSGAAFADDGYTIKVGRDYDATVQTTNITSTASGAKSRADINVGGMQVENANVDIGKDFKTNVKTGAITALASGASSSARINVGGIQQGIHN